MFFYILYLLFAATTLQTAACQPTKQAIDQVQPTEQNVYHELFPLLTSSISIENPTDDDQAFLNCAYGFMTHGTDTTHLDHETINTLKSVSFFSHILPKYFTTKTLSGYIQAALISSKLTDNIALLQDRQKAVTFFASHQNALKVTQLALQQASAGEREIMSLYKPIAAEQKFAHEQMVYKTSFSSNMFKSFNNKYILGTLKRLKQLDIPFIPTAAATLVSITFALYVRHNFTFSESIQAGLIATKNLPANMALGLKNMLVYGKFEDKASAIYLITLIGVGKIIGCYDVYQDFKVIYAQQQSLIHVAQLIKAINKISGIIATNPELKDFFAEEYKLLRKLSNPETADISDNLKYLLKELLSSSFTGSPSFYFSKQGKILATHYYLNECRTELIPYLEALGKIDAYATTANLYLQYHDHPNVHFCLPTFIDQYEPVLDITEYWHPLIDPMHVVSNSLGMGINGIKDVMITGPNAGGKTTSLMSLIINIIFAQSFAIAPSSSMIFTPFAKIHSYLDITTNLQEGLSLFAAEVDRAKKLKQSILSCLPGQKTFTIIDEIFSGTAPQVASDVGYTFAKQLGETAHSMTIITTHFPRLTDLEKDFGLFTNYKVADATIMPNGAIVYPFKLVPGISTQNIAQYMLEAQGVI